MHRWSFCFVHEHSDEGPLGNATRSRRLPRVPAHVSSTPPASSAARRCEDADPRRGRREGHGHRRRRTTPRGGRYLAGGRSRGSLVTNARERVKPTRSCRRRTARGQPDEHRLPHSPAAGCPPAKRAAPARSALPAHQCASLRARFPRHHVGDTAGSSAVVQKKPAAVNFCRAVGTWRCQNARASDSRSIGLPGSLGRSSSLGSAAR